MTQETAHERTTIDFTEFEKAIEGAGVFTHVEDAMWVTDKAHELIKVNNSVSTEEISFEKLQEQLNTAKYFFKNILDVNPNLHGGNSVRHLQNCVHVMKTSAEKALAALEGGEGGK